MKRHLLIIAVALALLVLALPAWAATTAYQKTALTGGGASALDGVNGSLLADGDFAFVMAGGTFYIYLLNATSGASPSTPDVISPTTNAGDKRWILQAVYGAGGLSGGTQYYLPVWTASDALGKLAALGTAGNPLISGGAGANPSWLSVVLAGGTNTFSITNGTASLSVAAGKTVNFSGTFTDGKICSYTASGNVISCNTSATGVGDFFADGSVPMTGAIVPNSAGGQTIGSATLPFSSIFIGNAATNNIQLTGTAASAKVVTLPGQTGTVTVGPTTTTAGKAFIGTTTAGLGAWSTGVLSLGTNLTTQTGAVTLTGAVAGSTLNLGTNLTTQTGAITLTGQAGGSTLTLPTALSITGTLTDGKYCTYTASGNVISCNSEGGASGAMATDTLWDAKGDLAIGTGANTGARLAVGADYSLLYPKASETTGMAWLAPVNSSIVGYNGSGVLAAYNTITLFDDAAQINNLADNTKQLQFSLDSATASTKTTVSVSQTANRAISMPDAAGKIQVAPANTTADKIALGTTTDGLLAWSTNTIDLYATLASPTFTGTVVLPAATVGAAEVKTIMKTEGATVNIGNGTDAIAEGVHKGSAFRVPFKATLTKIILTSTEQSGALTIDVWKGAAHATTGLAALTVANSIFSGGGKPAIADASSDNYFEVTSFDSGENAVAEGEWVIIKVDSITTLTSASVGFVFTRTD